MARRRLSNLGCSVLPNKRKPPFSGSATFGADAEESARFALSLSIAGESRNFRSRDPRNRFLAKVKDFPGCETQLKPAGFEPIDARMIHFRLPFGDISDAVARIHSTWGDERSTVFLIQTQE